jgi:type II secretory pathway pseudopilin PulG
MKYSQNYLRSLNRRKASGFSLVESVFAIVIVGTMFAAAMSTLGASKRTQLRLTKQNQAAWLADSLLAEIMEQAYIEPTESVVTFGKEALETGQSNRSTYDDVDDYHNLKTSPPVLKDGSAIDGIGATWKRKITISWIDPTNVPNTAASDKGLKKIVVDVYENDVLVTSRYGYRQQRSDLGR